MKWTIGIVCIALACNFIIGDPIHLGDACNAIFRGAIYYGTLLVHGQFRRIF